MSSVVDSKASSTLSFVKLYNITVIKNKICFKLYNNNITVKKHNFYFVLQYTTVSTAQ